MTKPCTSSKNHDDDHYSLEKRDRIAMLKLRFADTILSKAVQVKVSQVDVRANDKKKTGDLKIRKQEIAKLAREAAGKELEQVGRNVSEH